MKKIINIFIILFLLIYVEALNVNASVNKCQNSVLITEDSQATDTGWAANMVVCADYRFTNTYRTVGNGYDSINYSVFSDVKKIGRILVEAYQRSIDNKEVVSVQVPLCNDSRAGIGVVVTCHYYKYVKDADVVPAKTEAQCNPRPRSQCNSGCMWDASVTLERESAKPQNGINIQPMFDATGGKCVVDESVTKYDCGSYHVNKTNGKCYSWTEYVYDKPDPIKLDETENRSGYLSEASEACRNNYGSTDYACQCLDKDIKYAFKCPLYECTKGTLSVRTCTPTFSKQGENNKKVNVYCVNPSLPFEKIYNETAEYIPDDEFNVNDCSSSYSTVDCGYANILIEGQYNNWNYKTIELALRLWGAYTNQKGYNGVGISNRRTKYSDNKCGKSVTFLLDDDDEVINPYKRTVAEAYKMYFETISNKDYYDPKKEYSKVSLNCSITQGGRTVYLHGVACSGDNYKKAVALFFNTVSGNPKMREHLSSLFGNEISTEVTNALLRVDEHDKPYIEIKLPEFDKVTQPKNVKLECDKLDDLVREGKLTEEQKEQILPYCQIHIQLVDENGRVIKDNGRPYGDAEPDYCEKDYCVLYVHEFAICEYVESTHHVPYIKVTYPKSRSSNSILKLWSCEDPDDTQTMFAFASDLIQEPGKPEKVTQKFKISKYTCTNDCEEVPQDKINNKCEDNNGEYGNVYKSGIKDLSLNVF